MAKIYQTNKKTGITYVIESESYWDKEKQQPRSHRTIIGKVDPDTGEVVPTRKYNREKKTTSPSNVRSSGIHASSVALEKPDDLAEHIRELEQQVSSYGKRKKPSSAI